MFVLFSMVLLFRVNAFYVDPNLNSIFLICCFFIKIFSYLITLLFTFIAEYKTSRSSETRFHMLNSFFLIYIFVFSFKFKTFSYVLRYIFSNIYYNICTHQYTCNYKRHRHLCRKN